MSNQTFDYGDLRITLTKNHEWVWDDSGNGASKSITCYLPRAQGDMKALGCAAIPDYGTMDGKKAVLLVGNNPNRSPAKPAVAKPTGFTEISNDRGSGGHHDGTFWRPTPPTGYVAVGDVVQLGYNNPPDVNRIWCLRSDLVKNGPYTTEPLWTDQGSGASLDSSVWTVVPESFGIQGAEYIPISSGVFRAHNRITAPSSELAYTPMLYVPNKLSRFDKAVPTVTPSTIPSTGDQYDLTEQCRITLPFTAFLPSHDPRCLDKISNPFISASRTIAWNVEGVWVNNSGGDYERTKEVTYGISNTQSTEMQNSAGISISATYGLKGGAEFNVSLNYQFTYTSSQSYTEYSERKTTEKFKVKNNKATVLFSKRVWIKAERADRSSILSQVEIVANDDIRFGGCDL